MESAVLTEKLLPLESPSLSPFQRRVSLYQAPVAFASPWTARTFAHSLLLSWLHFIARVTAYSCSAQSN